MRAGGKTGTFEELFPVIRSSFLDGDHLIYHRREDEFTRYLDAGGKRHRVFDEAFVVRWEVRTRCGLLLDWWSRAEPDNQCRYTTLRWDFADAVARPCRKCWDVQP